MARLIGIVVAVVLLVSVAPVLPSDSFVALSRLPADLSPLDDADLAAVEGGDEWFAFWFWDVMDWGHKDHKDRKAHMAHMAKDHKDRKDHKDHMAKDHKDRKAHKAHMAKDHKGH
jgi:hypothetical protein